MNANKPAASFYFFFNLCKFLGLAGWKNFFDADSISSSKPLSFGTKNPKITEGNIHNLRIQFSTQKRSKYVCVEERCFD